MALVKYGGGVSSMSGKLGGTVAARNRSGAYFRNWAFPTNTPTASQTARRTSFAALSSAWGGIPESKRELWESWASTLTLFNRQGDAYTPTGRQMFMSLNTNLLLIREPIIEEPPSTATPPTIASHSTLSLTSFGGAIDIYSLDNADTGTTNHLQIWSAPEQTTGKQNLTLLYRVLVTGLENSSFSFGAEFASMFGSVATAGAIVKVKARMIDPATGLSSPFLIVEGVVS